MSITQKSLAVKIVIILTMLLAVFSTTSARPGTSARQTVVAIRFAVIGDFGKSNQYALDVSNLVKSWKPGFVITVGDNNYPNGEASTIDVNIGQYYHQFIYPYTGSYGAGATSRRFFPALGNHDWNTGNVQAHLNYFVLPGNERYYDYIRGPVHFFVLDSEVLEPDGNTSTSIQAMWLKGKLAASTSTWNVVYLHHPPYSSGRTHGSNTNLQWPYATWGADVVIAGHDHFYERISRDGILYFVNGLGGHATKYPFGTPVVGSKKRYNGDHGAMLVYANTTRMTFKFITRTGVLIDAYTLNVQPVSVKVNRDLVRQGLHNVPSFRNVVPR